MLSPGSVLACHETLRSTERKKLDTKFKLESLVEAAGDAIVAADTSGRIVLWNPAAERIFGFTAQEAVGQTLDLIIPPRFRDRHWTGYRQVMLSGRSKYGTEVLRVPALHKDGRPLSIAFTVGLLPDADGKIAAIAAIVRDETTRWNEEREMRRRLSELEQQLRETALK